MEYLNPKYEIGQKVMLRVPPNYDTFFTNDLNQETSALRGLLYTEDMAKIANWGRIHTIVRRNWNTRYNTYVYYLSGPAYGWLEGWLKPVKKMPQISDNLLTRLLFISGMKEAHE